MRTPINEREGTPERNRKSGLVADILIMVLGTFRRGEMSIPQNSTWKTRLVEGGFPDRSFDIEFWQEQGDEAIFAAAWEMVELAEETSHGRKPTLQRTATTLKRI
jgi:hypothetical protein